jgi:tetratricopeptide (TPR) repeat protein
LTIANAKIEKFRKMVEAFPGSPLPRFSLANAYAEAGNYAEAIPHYEACLAAQPGWAACLIALGDAQVELGHKEEAAEAYRRARACAPHGSLADEAQEKLEELGYPD